MTDDHYDRIRRMEQDIALIKQRNERVQADKAWELSNFRIAAICLITYVVAAILLMTIGAERFWLHSLVPTLGFLLSAQSLPVLKRWWIKHRYRS